MAKLLVEEILLPEGPDFAHPHLLGLVRLAVELRLALLHLAVEEKPVVLAQVRLLVDFYLRQCRLHELGLHDADQLHEERGVRS